MDLVMDFKVPYHMDGSMSGYFFMMDDVTGLWDCNELSMEHGYYGGQ